MVSRDYFGRIFDEMAREFREVDEMIDSMFRTARSWTPETGTIEDPYYYGFSINIGPDGKPIVREFGNVRPTGQGQVALTAREPMLQTLLDDKENLVKIAAEMPGVTREDIKVETTEDTVTISAERGDKKYHTEVPLSVKVDPDTADAAYNNGVLELTLKLKESIKPKGRNIKVK